MQTLITAVQMKDADKHAIRNQQISSIDLMEKAARAFVKVFKKEVPNQKTKIGILCGKGNNGGDGLAIARLLIEAKYVALQVYVFDFSDKESADFSRNLERLHALQVPIHRLDNAVALNLNGQVIIDAVLGAGLNKPLMGEYELLAKKINQSRQIVIAVDVPTGFSGDGPIDNSYIAIKADLVISFQRPKINFFFPESINALDRFKTVDIGLSETFIDGQSSRWKLTEKKDVRLMLKCRKNFSHKGTYGHALLIAGAENTMGAALLCAKSCLLTGAGLTTTCIPISGFAAVNATLPEVMTLQRTPEFSVSPQTKYNIVAIGPGLGINQETENLFEKLIEDRGPLVVDADALSILSERTDLLNKLQPGTILTPHMKEFDRIFGNHQNWLHRVDRALEEAVSRSIVIVLKNQFTFVCLPTGEIRINPTGNPAMASGGMGDVLTGMITSFLAQSYSPADAAILAVYLHGKAGDLLAKTNGVVIASQIAMEIPKLLFKYTKKKD